MPISLKFTLMRFWIRLKELCWDSDLELTRLTIAMVNFFMGVSFLCGISMDGLPYFTKLFQILPIELCGFLLTLHGVVSCFFLIAKSKTNFVTVLGRIFCCFFWSSLLYLMILCGESLLSIIPIAMIASMSWWILARTNKHG